jgi:hypothetical protein
MESVKMANLVTLVFGALPGEPKATSLDAVRRILEKAGVMARGDAFLAQDLVKQIVADEESKVTLETASKEAEGLRLLTIRRGPKKSAVKVVKGEASWSVMPDITQTLASFRGVLAEKMTPADQFWRKGGPVFDESEFSIENALDDGVLTIGPPASPSRQTILVAKGVKPENLKLVEIDVSQNLAQLRAKLEADKFMVATETFVSSDGASLSKAEEAGRSIKVVAGADKLITITSGWI